MNDKDVICKWVRDFVKLIMNVLFLFIFMSIGGGFFVLYEILGYDIFIFMFFNFMV